MTCYIIKIIKITFMTMVPVKQFKNRDKNNMENKLN